MNSRPSPTAPILIVMAILVGPPSAYVAGCCQPQVPCQFQLSARQFIDDKGIVRFRFQCGLHETDPLSKACLHLCRGRCIRTVLAISQLAPRHGESNIRYELLSYPLRPFAYDGVMAPCRRNSRCNGFALSPW